jgi:hypothetical protein
VVSVAENRGTLVESHLAHHRGGADRGGDGGVHLLLRGLVDDRDGGTVIGQLHGLCGVPGDLLAVDVERIFHSCSSS